MGPSGRRVREAVAAVVAAVGAIQIDERPEVEFPRGNTAISQQRTTEKYEGRCQGPANLHRVPTFLVPDATGGSTFPGCDSKHKRIAKGILTGHGKPASIHAL